MKDTIPTKFIITRLSKMESKDLDLYDLLFDSSKQVAERATELVGDNQERFKKILNFALEDKEQFAMRAMRVVNLVTDRDPKLIQPYINDLITGLPKYNTIGLRRGIAKVLSENDYEFDEEEAGILVDTCFNWLNDPAEAIALKIYAMQILYNISIVYPEIKPELISSIENEIPKNSPAIRGRGRRILKKLYKEIQN